MWFKKQKEQQKQIDKLEKAVKFIKFKEEYPGLNFQLDDPTNFIVDVCYWGEKIAEVKHIASNSACGNGDIYSLKIMDSFTPAGNTFKDKQFMYKEIVGNLEKYKRNIWLDVFNLDI